MEAVQFIKNLAKKQNAPALAQLASRISSAMKLSHGADVFAKIKGMIGDMIEKLEQEAAEAAELKEWCDKEIAESTAKKEDITATFEKLTTEIDKIRADEKAAFEKNHPEMEQGLKGVKLALKILNDYYAKADKSHSSSEGAGSGIIGMLE